MKIKKSVLENMIREELIKHTMELYEAEKKSDVSVVDASDENDHDVNDDGEKVNDKQKSKDKKNVNEPAKKSPEKAPEKKKELPVKDEPADDDLEKDVAGSEEDIEDVTGGKISKEIVGKTIQSVTAEPKSKILPGAQEINLTFNESPDPLKILITNSGQVKFYYRNALHNEL
jgi:hypothetical protein